MVDALVRLGDDTERGGSLGSDIQRIIGEVWMAVRVNVRLRINDDSGRGVEFGAPDAPRPPDEPDVLDAESRFEPRIDQVLPTGSSTLAPGLSLPVA